MLTCPECRSQLIAREDASAFLVQESDIRDRPDFWPHVESAIKANREAVRTPWLFRWRWAVGAASVLIAVTAGLWLYPTLTSRSPAGEIQQPDRFRLNYVRIDEKPARTFLYQPKDTDMIFIWAGKNGGGV